MPSPPSAALTLQSKFPTMLIDKQHHFDGANFSAFELVLQAAVGPCPALGALLRGTCARPTGEGIQTMYSLGACMAQFKAGTLAFSPCP